MCTIKRFNKYYRMKFGIGVFGDAGFDLQTNQYRSPEMGLHKIVTDVKLADELGIDILAMVDHHREDYAV